MFLGDVQSGSGAGAGAAAGAAGAAGSGAGAVVWAMTEAGNSAAQAAKATDGRRGGFLFMSKSPDGWCRKDAFRYAVSISCATEYCPYNSISWIIDSDMESSLKSTIGTRLVRQILHSHIYGAMVRAPMSGRRSNLDRRDEGDGCVAFARLVATPQIRGPFMPFGRFADATIRHQDAL